MSKLWSMIFWIGIISAEEYKAYEYCHVKAESHEPWPEVYPDPTIEFDGHLWRPIMLQHHPDCKCLDKPI